MATSGMKKILIMIYIGTFSMMTPLGIAIGIALTQTANEEDGAQNVTIAVLHGLAAGTLVYVVFFEILEKERAKKSNGLLQVTFIVLGFIVMILVSLLEGEHHHFEGEEEFCNINPKNIFEQYSSIDSLNVTCNHGAFMIHS